MKLARIIAGSSLIIALLGGGHPTCAEEIILKSGQKIVGTIVGYENDMFRVETEYGIALVRKDKVASIQLSKPDDAKTGVEAPKGESAKNPGSKSVGATTPVMAPGASSVAPGSGAIRPTTTANSNSSATMPPGVPMHPQPSAPPPSAPPQSEAASINSPVPPSPAPKAVEEKPSRVAEAPEGPASAPPAGTGPVANRPSRIATSDSSLAMPAVPEHQPVQAPPPAPVKPPVPPPPPASHPLDVPMPAHLQERVDGNTYVNDTFQFSMFKPPDWKIYEGVPKETGSGIMAMGTEDEQTLLIVDRQVWSGPPKLTSDQVEAKLRQIYQEYHRISEDAFECDSQRVTRMIFTGIVEGAEWHGMAVHVIHGNTVFGIIGLTSAETFQFQEAIFNKVIKTFHFLAASAPAAGLPNP